MKVLVTGATGFLGTGLCRALSLQNFSVRALVRSTSRIQALKNLKGLSFHTGDVTHLDSLKEAARGVDVVFHLAGVVSYSPKDRPLMEKVNVQGTAHVIEVCQSQRVRLVHISSIVAVGASPTPRVLNEDSPYNMQKYRIGYFDTKREAEVLVRKACRSRNLQAVILNPSRVYGPGDMEKASRSIQLKVVRGRCPFYTLGGVSVVDRDSVVKACLSAIHKGRCGERYILSGDNISVKKLLTLMAEASGVKAPFIPVPGVILKSVAGAGVVCRLMGLPLGLDTLRMASFYHWFDHQKAKKDLNFHPAPARQAIESSVHWWKNRVKPPA